MCIYFLHKLKDQGFLVIRHIAQEMNDPDIFTKKMMSAVFNRHVALYAAKDKYVRTKMCCALQDPAKTQLQAVPRQSEQHA